MLLYIMCQAPPCPLPTVEQNVVLPSFRVRETFSLSSNPLFAQRGRGLGYRNNMCLCYKCTFGAVVWHELSLIDHELSLIIFDDWLRRAKGS